MSLPFVEYMADGASVCARLMQVDKGILLVHQQQIMKAVCVCVPLQLGILLVHQQQIMKAVCVCVSLPLGIFLVHQQQIMKAYVSVCHCNYPLSFV